MSKDLIDNPNFTMLEDVDDYADCLNIVADSIKSGDVSEIKRLNDSLQEIHGDLSRQQVYYITEILVNAISNNNQ